MKEFASIPAIVVGLIALSFAAIAIAGPSTRATKITFSAPVRVPGTTLSAGTYYFKVPHVSIREIVRIEDSNRRFVTQFMGVADYTQKRDHEVIIFGDHACGSNAIKSWFYPNSGLGVRFIYPKQEAAEIAASCGEPVPETHETNADVSQLDAATVYLMTPQKEEEPYTAEALSATDQLDQRGFDAVSH